MKLVINCGTSSIKMTLFNKKKRVIDGQLKNLISSKDSYAAGIKKILKEFNEKGFSTDHIETIGHRVVHGGEKYTHSVKITQKVEKDLDDLAELAPLHNRLAITAINFCKKEFPKAEQMAVFDTAFFSSLPPKAAFYAIPWSFSKKYKIKRYGFHGIAHEFSSKMYERKYGKGKIITVHLGSGCSLAAIKNGLPVDTSMGFTPLDGVMMATRSGELDPAIVSFLSQKLKKSPSRIIDILNSQSGLLGVSGTSSQMTKLINNQSFQSKLAVDMFVYQVVKKIGSYIAVLNGIDALVFSGGIGENSREIRKQIADSLSWCHVSIDNKKNESCFQSSPVKPGEIKKISIDQSKIAIFVVGTDENAFISNEMENL